LSKRLIVLLAGALAIAAVVAGCGSSGDSTETDEVTIALSKDEFIKQGDQICKEAEADSEAEAEDFAKENGFELESASEEQLEEAISEVLVPSLNRQIDEIDALGAPEGDEGKVEAIVVALEDGSAEVEDDPSLAIKGEPLKDASRLAKAYGFKVCGE
jgi:hypothetical protein